MNPARRAFLRDVMETAWSLYRAELRGPSPRTFANALAGAWAWVKGRAARAVSNAAFLRRHRGGVAFGSLIGSPIRRSLGSAPHAGDRFRTACATTSRLGR